MADIFGIQPLPQASFLEYVNTTPESKFDLNQLYKLKEYQMKKQEMHDKFAADAIEQQTKFMMDPNSPVNLAPVTEFHKGVLKDVGNIFNDASTKMKSVIAQENISPVDIANIGYETAARLKDPRIQTGMKEMQMFQQMRDEAIKNPDKYDADELGVYMNDNSSRTTPFDKIDFGVMKKVDLNTVTQDLIKSATKKGSSISEHPEYGLISDDKSEYLNVDNVRDGLLQRINLSPSLQRKVKELGLTPEEYANQEAQKATTGWEPVAGSPGTYRSITDRQFQKIEYSPWQKEQAEAMYRATGKGSGTSTGIGTSIEDQLKTYDKVGDGLFNFVVPMGQGKSLDGNIVQSYEKTLSSNLTKFQTAQQFATQQLQSYEKKDDNFVIKKYKDGSPVTDVNGNLINYKEDYDSLINEANRNKFMADSVKKVDQQVEEDLKKKGLTNTDPNGKYSYAAYAAGTHIEYHRTADGNQPKVVPNDPSQEAYQKYLKANNPSVINYYKEKEASLKKIMGENSFFPMTYAINDKDIDVKNTITPLQSGTGIENYRVTDGSLNQLKAEDFAQKNLEFIDVINNPYTGEHQMHFREYDPVVSQKAKVPEKEGTTNNRQYQVAKYGKDIYLTNDNFNNMFSKSLYGQSGNLVSAVRGTINNKIKTTGIAEFKPGELESNGLTIGRDENNPSNYAVYLKDGAGRVKKQSWTDAQLDKFIVTLATQRPGEAATDEKKASGPVLVNSADYINKKFRGIDPEGAPKNIGTGNERIYNLFTAAEGNADGTANPNDSGQGTVGNVQISWPAWHKEIVSKGYAKSEEEFRKDPQAQKKFFTEVIAPYNDRFLSQIESVPNLKEKLLTIKGTTGVDLLSGGEPDTDKLKYMIHNMGGQGALNSINSLNISDQKTKELKTALSKLEAARDNTLISAIDTLGKNYVSAKEGDVLVNAKHLPVIKKAVETFGLSLTSGYRSEEENSKLPNSSKTSNHMRAKAYDFSTKGLNQEQINQAIAFFIANGANKSQTGVHDGNHIHVDFS